MNMAFARPLMLLVALPWLVLWLWTARHHIQAAQWLEANIGDRFRHHYTAHGPIVRRLHLALIAILGLLLIVAASGPVNRDLLDVTREGGRILLLIDGSASMYASDVGPDGAVPDTAAGQAKSRFDLAKKIAAAVLEAHSERQVAVVTWSGSAAPELPMTLDRDLVQQTLRDLEAHTFYQRTGSSFQGALDSILPFAVDASFDLQVVMIGDGELMPAADYDEALDAVAQAGVPVHTVGVGSLEGQKRVIYDFNDVRAGKKPEDRRRLTDYKTHRVDAHFQRIAKETGGLFVTEDATFEHRAAAQIADAIARHVPRPGLLERTDSAFKAANPGRELGRPLLAVATLGFLIHTLLIGRGRRQNDDFFDLSRLGELPEAEIDHGTAKRSPAASLGATLVLMLLGCADEPLEKAHVENERGIALSSLSQTLLARTHFERSRAYGQKEHIPIHNLARTLTAEGELAEAHALFQEALELAPDLAEAYFNDGVALHLWGEAEKDPRGCHLKRTHDLWSHALRRFEHLQELTPEAGQIAELASENAAAVRDHLQELEHLIENPPPACADDRASSSQDSSSAQGSKAQEPPDTEQDLPSDPSSQDSGSPPPTGPGADSPTSPSQPDQNAGQQPAGSGLHDHPRSAGATPPDDVESLPGLSPEQQGEIQQALARISEEAGNENAFHRKTRAEQFAKATWSQPDEELWW